MPIYYDNLDLSPKDLFRFYIVILSLGMTIGFLFYENGYVGIIFSCLFYLSLPKYKAHLAEKRKQQLILQFRDVLYSLSSSIYSGRNMSKALEEAKEFCKGTYSPSDYIIKELDYMTKAIENGMETDTVVLRDFAKRSGLEDIEDFVNVYENCKSSGGNLPQTINRAITIIGDKIGLEHEMKSIFAQKIFEGRIVGLAPVGMVLFIKLSSPEYYLPMTTTSAGRMATTIALTLMGIGLLYIEEVKKIDI